MQKNSETEILFKNDVINKSQLKGLMALAFQKYGTVKSSIIADRIKNLTFHYATRSGISISIEDMPADLIEREKNILAEEARSSGKPEEIIEKMTEGRLKKYYQESVLLEQIFVVDGESKISDILNSLDKPVKIVEFVRMGLGEGIEKKSEDFANEVDSLIS